jgi:YfiH family protein
MEIAPAFWKSPLHSAVPWLAHGVTHRTGGYSDAPYSSLNLGLHVHDDPALVLKNRERAAEALGFTAAQIVTAEQVHGGKVAAVTDADAGTTKPAVDGLVTNTPGLLLALFFADCVPVLFVDPEHRAVGVAHAGWRGMVGGILEETVAAMRKSFGTRPETLLAAIGPCIGRCCFEVGAEVAAEFPNETVIGTEWPRPHVDLVTAAENRLMSAGIPPGSIARADECTSCLPDRYFSYRRDNGRTGRMAALIGIYSDAV